MRHLCLMLTALKLKIWNVSQQQQQQQQQLLKLLDCDARSEKRIVAKTSLLRLDISVRPAR